MKKLAKLTKETFLPVRQSVNLTKRYYIFLSLLFSFSCSETETKPYDPKEPGKLHPPAWIQGVWTNQRNPALALKFTENDFLVIDGKDETSQLGSTFVSNISEIDTLSGYTINYKDANSHLSYYFEMEQDTFLFLSYSKDGKLMVAKEPYLK